VRIASIFRAAQRVPLLQVVKSAVATVAAWLIASAVRPDQLPVFGAIAALLVVQPSVNQSFGKAVERSIGVIVGVLVAYGVGLVFGGSSAIVLIAIVFAIFVAWALRLTPGGANQVPISAMLVLSIGAATPGYAFDRIIETVIGAVIGLIVNMLIVPPALLQPAHDAVHALAAESAATLERLAGALTRPQTSADREELLVTARLLRPMQLKAAAALGQGEESLTFNPRRAKLRAPLEADAALNERLTPLVTQVIGMTRALYDRYDEELHREPAVHAIAEELTRAAHDVRLLARGSRPDAATTEHAAETAAVPALTAPLTIAVPSTRHWVLLGSLLEDLRRVHEELTIAPESDATAAR
jgi:uncharacterized membrane protein YccC